MTALSPARVVIVGHTGRMGSLLRARFAAAGHGAAGVDRRPGGDGAPVFDPGELRRRIPEGDVVLLCVPVSALRGVLAEVVPHMRPGQILADVTSVKVLPMAWMEEAWNGPVVGSHPLFGPQPDPADMRVVLTPGKNSPEAASALVERLFRDTGCTVFRATPDEHDTGTGFAQSLNFTLSAAFFALLARHPEVRPFLTPSFRRHMESARKHLTRDTAMFCEFTAANPRFADALRAYQNILAEAGGGREALAALAEEAAVWYTDEMAKPR